MADPKKVRWSQLKVGVVGLAAFLILAALIFLLTSSKGFFQKTAFLHTFMDDAGGMAACPPLRLTRRDRTDHRGRAQAVGEIHHESAGDLSPPDSGGFGGRRQRCQPAGR